MTTTPTTTAAPIAGSGSPEGAASEQKVSWLAHVFVGTLFGIIVTKAEVISWFRIQEMFRFDSFHLYGIIGSAVAVGAISLWIIKRLGAHTVRREQISIPPKDFGTGFRVAVGGTIFGLGWGMTGACPGPIFALIGNGVTVMIVVLASALAGTWVYGHVRHRLPH